VSGRNRRVLPVALIPAKVSCPNPQRSLGSGRGNASSCPEAGTEIGKGQDDDRQARGKRRAGRLAGAPTPTSSISQMVSPRTLRQICRGLPGMLVISRNTALEAVILAGLSGHQVGTVENGSGTCRHLLCFEWGVILAHLTRPYQPSPIRRSGRPAHRPFRDLLGVHSRCGLHTRAVTKS
jgi:hypothetical protein